MKICLFINAFWSTGNSISGGDKRTIEIVKRWIENYKNLNLSVFTPLKGINLFLSNNISNINFKKTSLLFSEKNIILGYIIHTLIAIIKLPIFSKGYIFYSTSDFFPDIFPAMVGKTINSKSKWVAITHHMVKHYMFREGSFINNFISYYAQKVSFLFMRFFADRVLVDTELSKNELVRIGFREEKIYLISNGVDFSLIEQISLSGSEEYFDGTFLARLHPSKGIFDLVEIWKRIFEKRPNARLAIIGGGSDKIVLELTNKIKEYKLDNNVKIFGFLDFDSTFKIIKKSSVFMLPSHEEGWGIVIVEAMACKKPVVVYNLPVYDYIFEDYIIKIEENNHEKFADAVLNFIDNKSLAVSFSKDGYNFIKKYDWDLIAENEIELLTNF